MKSMANCQPSPEKYEAPVWAAGLKSVPTHIFKLSNRNTPLERWNLPGVPDDFEVFIKRDDMTGSVLSGNKVRKLELLFADAIQQGCTSVITAGALTSNHCRTTAIIARSLGMEPHIMLNTDQDPDSLPYAGNYLLDQLVGAHIYYIPSTSTLQGDVWPRMRQLADKIWKETGKKAYAIPPGGSNAVGMFGYVNSFAEMVNQGMLEDHFTDIVSATGTGGTSAGLILGNHLTGNQLKIHGMVVSKSFDHREINQMLKDVGLQNSDGAGVQSEDSINITHGPIGAGYGISTPDELEFIINVARQTGIILDPIYTGKAAYHLVKQFNTKPASFKGKKIIFIHTGGMFALFDGRMQDILANNGAVDQKVKSTADCLQSLEVYEAPVWAAGLKAVPTHKVKLAISNTPIQRWNLPGVPDGFEIYIKHDDTTGSVLSGNKVRKLEFLFADAIHQGCTSVITCGGVQSNFCRATAICARSLGMEAHLLLKTDKDPDSIPCAGNYLLDHIVGAHIHFIPSTSTLHDDVWPRMRQLADNIWKETGEKAYAMPFGGSTSVGMFGYVNAFEEIMNQSNSVTDIVSAVGSGGTSAGLIVGNHLTGNRVKLHGMVVGDTSSLHHSEINQMLKDVGLQNQDGTGLISEDAINMVDGPIGAGYAISSPEEIGLGTKRYDGLSRDLMTRVIKGSREFITNVARQTGVILDPVYTGKTVYHLVKQLNTNPGIFKGKKIIFIHTGGMFALFDGRMEAALKSKAQE